jgi:uncharacterized protein YbjT (DUF2867 family)
MATSGRGADPAQHRLYHPDMPVIVIGADAPGGEAIVRLLLHREGEVRAFVTDREVAGRLRASGVKVATGDVSDFGHIEAAMRGCFSAVLLAAAVSDDRERSFAKTGQAVVDGWRIALADAAIQRAIWVSDDAITGSTPEHTVLDPSAAMDEMAGMVARLDEADSATWMELTAQD